MGIWYRIVNPAKREYIEIDGFGENIKWRGVVTGSRGQSLHAMAIAWLVCQRETGRGFGGDSIGGSWSGDPIYIAGDSSDPSLLDHLGVNPGQPEQNLYGLASSQYTNITAEVIAALCEKDQEIATILAERAYDDHPLFMKLCRTEVELNTGIMAWALEAKFGPEWSDIDESQLANPDRSWKEARDSGTPDVPNEEESSAFDFGSCSYQNLHEGGRSR